MRRTKPSPSASRRRSAILEAVESRRLLATLVGDVLEIAGTTAADTISVATDGADLVVTTNGVAQRFAASSVTSIAATLGDGNDSLLIADSVPAPASISGGAGDDTLRGGSGNDTIDGGDGLDTLTYAGRAAAIAATATMRIDREFDPDSGDFGPLYTSGFGTATAGAESDTFRFIDTLVGGEGDDSITMSTQQSNGVSSPPTRTILRAEGGGGNDTIFINSGFPADPDAFALIADGGAGNDAFDFGGNRDPFVATSLYGGAGNDTFRGTSDDGFYSLIEGGDGTDLLAVGSIVLRVWTIPGGVENFTYSGFANRLTVTGNALDNVIDVPEGSTVRGGAGDDTIRVGAAFGDTSVVDGEAGDDTIVGGNGDDSINGGDGDDLLQGGAGADVIEGGDGNDTVSAGDDNDVVRGDAGDDSIMGDDGDDAMNGGAGADFVGGGYGDDNLAGGDGDDQLAGDAGHDAVRGDAGNDRVAGNVGKDSLKGGDGDDTLLGQGSRDRLHGNAGSDSLIGGTGNDILSVDPDGVDTLSGGTGDDTAYLSSSASVLLASIERRVDD